MAEGEELDQAAVEAQLEATAEELGELDEVADQLAAHSILSEERHEEILEELGTCSERMESLQNQIRELPAMAAAENPLLSQVLNQIVELRTETAAIREEMRNLQGPRNSASTESKQSIPQPSESTPPETPAPESAEVAPPDRETPRRQKFRRI